jgi:hypothetical protein
VRFLIRSFAAAAAAVILLVASGCGASESGLSTFVGSNGTEALLVQWTQASSGALSGTLQVTTANSDLHADPVAAVTRSLSGTRTGGAVSFTIDFVATWNGTIKGDKLRIDVPQPQGGIQTVVLERGTVDSYNGAVSRLREQVQVERSRAEADQVAQSNADALLAGQQSLAEATAAIGAGLKELSSAVRAVVVDTNDLRAKRRAQDAAYAKVRRTHDCNQLGPNQSDEGAAFSEVGAALSNVNADAGSLESTADDVTASIRKFDDSAAAILGAGGPATDRAPAEAVGRKVSAARAVAAKAKADAQEMWDAGERVDQASSSVQGNC